MIFVGGHVFGQPSPLHKVDLLLMKPAAKPLLQAVPSSASLQNSLILSPAFYSTQLGFFCRQEIKVDKLTKISFRFRLGSVEACDRLEGKSPIH